MSPTRMWRFSGLPAMALPALTLLALAAGCSGGYDDGLPPGFLVAGDSAQLDPFLARLEALADTPAAAFAARLRERLAGCQLFAARVGEEEGGALLEALGCVEAADLSPELEAVRGGRALAFALPVAAGSRLVGTAEIDADGGLVLEARLPPPEASPLALLLPAVEAPAPGLFHTEDALLHGRVRADQALDFAAWVPEGGQVDAMFRLKSKLFSSLVLDGEWEAAVYMPREERPMPDVALALGFKDREVAIASVDAFLDDLGETWPIRRRAFRLEKRGAPQEEEAAADGECLSNLQLLPQLAPCWLALPEALVIGWNLESIRHALAGGSFPAKTDRGAGQAGEAPPSGLTVYLDRFAEADLRLARSVAPAEETAAAVPSEESLDDALPAPFPWRRLAARGERDGPLYHLLVELTTGPATE